MIETRCANDTGTGRIRSDLPLVLRQEVISTGHKLRSPGDISAGHNDHAVQVHFDFGACGCCRCGDADGVVERLINAAKGCSLDGQTVAAGINNIALDQVLAGEYCIRRCVARRRAAAVDEPHLAAIAGKAGVGAVEDIASGHGERAFLTVYLKSINNEYTVASSDLRVRRTAPAWRKPSPKSAKLCVFVTDYVSAMFADLTVPSVPLTLMVNCVLLVN